MRNEGQRAAISFTAKHFFTYLSHKTMAQISGKYARYIQISHKKKQAVEPRKGPRNQELTMSIMTIFSIFSIISPRFIID